MKTRRDSVPQMLVAILASIVIVLGLGMSAAGAAPPTKKQQETAREAAAAAGAEKVCVDVLSLEKGGRVEKQCSDLTKAALVHVSDYKNVTADVFCAPLAPVPGIGKSCRAGVKKALPTLIATMTSAYDLSIASIKKAPGVVKDFVPNASDAIEKAVNHVHESAVGFLNDVMGELVNIGNPDFTAKWWRSSYAAAGGIGLLVAAFMALFLMHDAARGKVSSNQVAEGLEYLVMGIVAMVFAPVIAYVVQGAIADFNKGIVHWGGENLYSVVLKGTIFSMNSGTMPGGLIMGLFFFLMLFLCAMAVFVMFIVQGMSVYIVSVGMAIGFGMLAHPKWRSKALRIPMLVLGIMLSKPLLLFILTVLFKMIDGFNPLSGMAQKPMATLGQGFMIIVALLMVGLAPFTLFKLVPLLPTGSEISGGGGNPLAAAAGGAAGVMMTKVAMSKMGGSGGGSGGSSPSPSSQSPAGKDSSSSPSGPGGEKSGGAPGDQGGPGDAGKAGAGSAPGGGDAGKAGAGSTPGGGDAGKAGADAAGGAGKAASTTAGGSGGAAAGAGGGAGGAAGGAGLAAGGVATGGALLMAAAAAKTAGAGAQAGKQVAESAGPQAQGPTAEESASNLHDQRKATE